MWSEVMRLLEEPALIQAELERRLEAARNAHPAKRREETLARDLVRVRKSMERLLSAYQEELLSLEELRRRMPPLRQREVALKAELESLSAQFADQAAYLRLAETLSAFLGRLRENVQTLNVVARQRIVRLLVKEVVVGKDSITIRHSIPTTVRSPEGGNGPSNPARASAGDLSGKGYLLCTGRDQSCAGQSVSALRV